MAKEEPAKPLKAGVDFRFDSGLDCFISSDLFQQLGGPKLYGADGGDVKAETLLISVSLCHYEPFQRSKIVNCKLDASLKSESIVLAAHIFGIQRDQPTVDTCDIWSFQKQAPVLKHVAIATHPILYARLMELENSSDRMQFVRLKAELDIDSIVHVGDVLLNQWCHVLDCEPYFQGLIYSELTEVIFVKDDSYLSSNTQSLTLEITGLQLAQSRALNVQIHSLLFPIHDDLLFPPSSKSDDDSLYVFATASTFLGLGLSSGMYVTLFTDSTSKVAKTMLLLTPNKFESNAFYVSPRLIALFRNSDTVGVKRSTYNPKSVPAASSVILARIGSWNNCQKPFENIISENLIAFLTQKHRVLKVGDRLPITFDSNLSSFYSEDFREADLQGENDSIVWFIVETVEIEDKTEYTGEFRIDRKKTTLLTQNLVAEAPLSLQKCDYESFFGLPSSFRYDPTVFDYAKRMINIVKAGLKCWEQKISIRTSIILQSSTPGVGKNTLVRFAAYDLGTHLIEIDCLSINSAQGSLESMNNTIGYLKAKLEPLLPFVAPSIVFLSHLDCLIEKEAEQQDSGTSRLNRSLALEIASLIDYCTSQGAIFACSVRDSDVLPDVVRSKMQFSIEVPVPNEQQRQSIFAWHLSLRELNSSSEGSFRFIFDASASLVKLAQRSAGLSPDDIKSIVQTAKTTALSSALSNDEFCDSYIQEGNFITIAETELISAIEKARDEFSDSIGAPKIPNVSWSDIGGMDLVKGEIMDTIDLPLKHPELFSSGLKKRSGILFYGPPGTGKTLLAKAIATNFSLNFFSVKGPELLNMYIGESEANVRRVFQRARDAKPCVIFFDELDSVAPKRGNQGDSGGVMDRIVSQLLAELDGMSSDGDGVFVIGATNRPDLLDEALLRPGRFDKLLYLGIPDTNEKQENVIRALSRKFVLDDSVDLAKLAVLCPFNYTGADFYALCSDAMLNSMTRTSRDVDKKVQLYCEKENREVSVRYWFDKVAKEDDANVIVKMEDYVKAQENLIPSVSREELAHYLRVKSNFEST
ncbi:LANO_0F00518g1_1 [Lachancea nothofagi CBS 11611]|uniref:Peroxisomal ATPase PEX6 n=1 Tax=Lachancea nothofagi CBS 11611 TaxID=1266666 RepID=A0A1G4K5E4_9SACH|nr:LANO_0F00518g1_1 [Lachancea nothofagi CBS 11611]